MQLLVIDTNVALDLLVFRDPSAAPLQDGLAQGTLRWLATHGMREEFARVLGYPAIGLRLAAAGVAAEHVLARFDQLASIVEAAPRAPLTCSDADDQQFIDLAVQHRCVLLSKDSAVLELRSRLRALQVTAGAALPVASYSLSER